MPLYHYKAKDKSGATLFGEVDATDEHEAAAQVRELGLFPMDIRAMQASSRPRQVVAADTPGMFSRILHSFWTGVGLRQLALFYRQMATLLNAGVAISDALNSTRARTRGRLQAIIDEACDGVAHGKPMSETMIRYPWVFSDLQLALVQAGEHGGMLEGCIDRLATYLEYELRVRRLIVKALFYPCMILAFVVLMPVVVKLIRPEAAKMLPYDPVELLAWYGPWLIAGWIVTRIAFQFEAPRAAWDALKTAPPLIGTAARKIAMSRFCRAFGTLYEAGLSHMQCVAIAADATANRHVARKLRSAIPSIQSGNPLTESLAATGALMPNVIDMLAVGEKTGDYNSVLQKISDYLEEEVDSTIQKLGIVIFVLSILAAGVAVAMIVVKFYSGYFGSMLGM